MDIEEMFSRQLALHEKHASDWSRLTPDTAPARLLWGIGEIGEVIDTVKKFGTSAIASDPVVRRHFTEEMGDVIMYLMDVLLCLGISAEEFAETYRAKCDRNLKRDYAAEKDDLRNKEAERQKG